MHYILYRHTQTQWPSNPGHVRTAEQRTQINIYMDTTVSGAWPAASSPTTSAPKLLRRPVAQAHGPRGCTGMSSRCCLHRPTPWRAASKHFAQPSMPEQISRGRRVPSTDHRGVVVPAPHLCLPCGVKGKARRPSKQSSSKCFSFFS